MGAARAKVGDWHGSVEAYGEAVTLPHARAGWHRSLNRGLRAIAGDAGDGEVHARFDRAFVACGGTAVIGAYLGTREAAGEERWDSEPLFGGGSNVHLAVHTVRSETSTATSGPNAAGGPAPQRIVHKVTHRSAEAAVMRLLQAVQDDLPDGIHMPQILDVSSTGDLHHILTEYVELGRDRLSPWGELTRSHGALRRAGHLYAQIGRIVPAATERASLPSSDHRAAGLAAACRRLATAPAVGRVAGSDSEPVAALRALEANATTLADAVADLPRLFAHNDGKWGNAFVVPADADDDLELLLLDWAEATENLAGADLHHFLIHAGLDADAEAALIDGYRAALRAAGTDVSSAQIALAARLQCVKWWSHRMAPRAPSAKIIRSLLGVVHDLPARLDAAVALAP